MKPEEQNQNAPTQRKKKEFLNAPKIKTTSTGEKRKNNQAG